MTLEERVSSYGIYLVMHHTGDINTFFKYYSKFTYYSEWIWSDAKTHCNIYKGNGFNLIMNNYIDIKYYGI